MKSFTADQASQGFVGVGAMGSRIVRRLRDHGYQVSVYNRNRAKAEALLPYGVSVAGSLADLGMSADVILSCLSDDDAVRSVYLGNDGILASSRPGQVVLEMSTVSPNTSRELHAEGAKHGVAVMDVAISGSTPAVEQGTVRLLVGGDAEPFRAAEPIFQALTGHYFLMGPSGAGTSMKLVVNALLRYRDAGNRRGSGAGRSRGPGPQPVALCFVSDDRRASSSLREAGESRARRLQSAIRYWIDEQGFPTDPGSGEVIESHATCNNRGLRSELSRVRGRSWC